MRDPLGPPRQQPRRPRWVTDSTQLDDPFYDRWAWGKLPPTAKGPASTVFVTVIAMLTVAAPVWMVLDALLTGG